jgi:hypothetical protein
VTAVRTLVVQQLLRTPVQGPEDRLALRPGVNVIVGAPNTGKSKWLRMLDYLMGDDGKPEEVFEELHDKYDTVEAVCQLANEEVVIERRWKEAGVKGKVFVNGEPILLKEFRVLLMERLAIPIVHYPQGNPYGPRSWPELGWRSLYRHMYRRQLMWSDLADQQPESEQHACLMQFLGIAEYLFSEQYASLVAKEKKIQELQQTKDQFIAMLDEVSREILDDKALGVALTPQSIEAAMSRMAEEIGERQRKRQELLAAVMAAATSDGGPLKGKSEAVEKLGEDLQRLRAEQDTVLAAVQKTQDRLHEVKRYRAAVGDELGRLGRARDAGQILPDLQITHCPACDREIAHEDNPTRCFLCKRELSDTGGFQVAAERRLDFEREQLEGEAKEADELIATLDREVQSLLSAKARIAEEIGRIQSLLRPVRAAAAVVMPPEISMLDMETGRLEERRRQLERIKASLAKRETLAQQISDVQRDVAALEAEVRAQSLKIDFERAGDLLQDGMNTYLNSIKEANEHSWTQDGIHVRLSDRDFRIKVGDTNWKTKLGGTLTLYFLISYHYALMTLTCLDGFHYPGLTVLDFPAKLEDGTQIKDKENFVVEPFVELLGRPEMKGSQFIAAGSAFENLAGAHRIELTKIWK